jgi:hypothetical protein
MARTRGHRRIHGSLLVFSVGLSLASACGGRLEPAPGGPGGPGDEGGPPATAQGRDASADSPSTQDASADGSAPESSEGPGCSTPPLGSATIEATYSLPALGSDCPALVGQILQPPQCAYLCQASICCCKVYEGTGGQLMVQCAIPPECPVGIGAC